eukprot:gene39821-12071_t
MAGANGFALPTEGGMERTHRLAAIRVVKGELQQPYNLGAGWPLSTCHPVGVITREQFVQVCSGATKEFLRDEATPGQTELVPGQEQRLRARTTALLTGVVGGTAPPPPPAPPRR